MASREDLENIKRATVALAFMHENGDPDPSKAPFTIIGSGFCVDPMGLIVTCQHVLAWFLNMDVEDLIAHVSDEDKKKELWPLRDARMIRRNVLFFDTERSKQHVVVFPVPMEMGIGKTDCDLGVLRVQRHVAFEDGYPSLGVEDYAEIYEGMDLATCGFLLGNHLQEQLGTATSSFTRGILSSIIPSPGAALEHVDAFQLDLTATLGTAVVQSLVGRAARSSVCCREVYWTRGKGSSLGSPRPSRSTRLLETAH